MNISDIAKLAGVSNAAVSRYFNNGYISEEKREAIRKVVEETGYRPSAQAQTLRTKKTKMIGVIIPKIASSAIGSVVEGIMEVLNQNNYQMLLADTANNPEKEMEYLNVFAQKQVDGVILVATIIIDAHKELLEKMKVPAVIIGQQLSGNYCVYHDEYHCMYDMTNIFLEKGCRHLGYISAPLVDKATGAYRYQGFCDALADFGIKDIEHQMIIGDFSYNSGFEAAKEFIENMKHLDGIICASDAMAMGAMQCLKEHGYRIPEDVMLSGHGNAMYTQITTPSVTTAKYSYYESGYKASEILLELIQGKESAVREIMLGYSIQERGSTNREKNGD